MQNRQNPHPTSYHIMPVNFPQRVGASVNLTNDIRPPSSGYPLKRSSNLPDMTCDLTIVDLDTTENIAITSRLPNPRANSNATESLPHQDNIFFQHIQVQAHLTNDPSVDYSKPHRHPKISEENTYRMSNQPDTADPNLLRHHRHRHHHHRYTLDDEEAGPSTSNGQKKKGPSVTTNEISLMRDIITEVEDAHRKNRHSRDDGEGERRHSRRYSRKSKELPDENLVHHHRHSHREPEVEETTEETKHRKHRHSRAVDDEAPEVEETMEETKHRKHRYSRAVDDEAPEVEETMEETKHRKHRHSRAVEDGAPPLSPEKEITKIFDAKDEQSRHHRKSRVAIEPEPEPSAVQPETNRRKSRKSQHTRKSKDVRIVEVTSDEKPHYLHRHHDEDKEPNFLIDRYINAAGSTVNRNSVSKNEDKKKIGRRSHAGPYPMDSSIRGDGLLTQATSREKQAVEPMQTTRQNIPPNIFKRGSGSVKEKKETKTLSKLDQNYNTITENGGETSTTPAPITPVRPRLPSFVFDTPPPPPKKGSSKRSKSKSKKGHHPQNFQTYMVLNDTEVPEGGGGGDISPATAMTEITAMSEEKASSGSGLGATNSSQDKGEELQNLDAIMQSIEEGDENLTQSVVPASGSYGKESKSKKSDPPEDDCCQPMLSMTDKGAIRLQLPGRIQHKTTIKLTHFPEGSSDSVVINVPTDGGNNATQANGEACQGQDPNAAMMPPGCNMNSMYGQYPSQYGQQPQVIYPGYQQQQQYPAYPYGQGQGEYYQQMQQNPYAQYGQYGYPPF